MLKAFFAIMGFVFISVMLVVGLITHRDAGRLFAPNVVIIAPLYGDDALFFSQAEIERLSASFPSYGISAASAGSAVISTQTTQVRATMHYASAAFFYVHYMNIVEGSPPQEHTNGLLLSELLAWRLFGGFDVTGVTVWAFGEPLVVSGVAAGGNIGYAAWLPGSFAPNAPKTTIYVRFPAYCIVSAHAVPREMLGFGGHEEYMMLDVNRYIEAIGIRNRLALYALWIIGLALCVRWLIGAAMLSNEKRLCKRACALLALVACGALLSVYVLFDGASGIIYALPNLSDENASLVGFVFGWVDKPPAEFISPNLARLFELNSRANIAFFGAVAAAVFGLGLAMRIKI